MWKKSYPTGILVAYYKDISSRSKLLTSARSWPSSSPTPSPPISPRPRPQRTRCTRCTCVKSRSSRSPNSTCPNFWKCTASLARSSREAPRTVRSLITTNPLCSRAFKPALSIKTFCWKHKNVLFICRLKEKPLKSNSWENQNQVFWWLLKDKKKWESIRFYVAKPLPQAFSQLLWKVQFTEMKFWGIPEIFT